MPFGLARAAIAFIPCEFALFPATRTLLHHSAENQDDREDEEQERKAKMSRQSSLGIRLAAGRLCLALVLLSLSAFFAAPSLAQAPAPSLAPRAQPARRGAAVPPQGGPVVESPMTTNRRATTPLPLPPPTTTLLPPRTAPEPLTPQPRALAPPPRAVPVPIPTGMSRRMLLQQQQQQQASAPSPSASPPSSALSTAATRAAVGAAASCAAGSVVFFAAQQECGSGLAGAQLWRATAAATSGSSKATSPKATTTILGLTLSPGALLYALDAKGATLVVPSDEGAGKGTALRGPYQLLLSPPSSLAASPNNASSSSSSSSYSLSWTAGLGFLASGPGAENATTGERPALQAGTRIDPLELTVNGRECRPLSLTVDDACVVREKGARCDDASNSNTCKVAYCCSPTADDSGGAGEQQQLLPAAGGSLSSSAAAPWAPAPGSLTYFSDTPTTLKQKKSKVELQAETDFPDSSSTSSSPLARRWRVVIGAAAAAVVGALALVVCAALAARARAQREAVKVAQRRERQRVAALAARTLGASKLAAVAAAAAASAAAAEEEEAAAQGREAPTSSKPTSPSASSSSSSSSRSPRKGNKSSLSEIESAERDPEMGDGSDEEFDDDEEARSVVGFPCSSSPSPSAAAAADAAAAAASASSAAASPPSVQAAMLASFQKGKQELSRRWSWNNNNATVASPASAAVSASAASAPSSSPLARGNSNINPPQQQQQSPSDDPLSPLALDLEIDPAAEISLGPRLGSGSFGNVHRCEYRGRACACKLLKASLVHELCEVGELEGEEGDGDDNGGVGGKVYSNINGASLLAASTFAREISIFASLPRHPRVVSLFAACLRPPTICLVEELVEGGSLADAIKAANSGSSSSSSSSLPQSPSSPSLPSAALDGDLRAGGLPYRQVLRIGADVAAALAHLHAHRVTHSDLKPGNILLDGEGRGKVVDFGVSRVIAGTLLSAGGGDDGPLQADTIAGATPAYAAPEQFEASRLSQAPSIDVWALGVVLNEAFTGRRHLDDVSQPLQVCDLLPFFFFFSQPENTKNFFFPTFFPPSIIPTGHLPRRGPQADAARVAVHAEGAQGAAARLLGDRPAAQADCRRVRAQARGGARAGRGRGCCRRVRKEFFFSTSSFFIWSFVTVVSFSSFLVPKKKTRRRAGMHARKKNFVRGAILLFLSSFFDFFSHFSCKKKSHWLSPFQRAA